MLSLEVQERHSLPYFPENANAVEFGLPFTTTSFAVALLLVFRTNEAYRRCIVRLTFSTALLLEMLFSEWSHGSASAHGQLHLHQTLL